MVTVVTMKFCYENYVSNVGQQVLHRATHSARFSLSACHQVATTLVERWVPPLKFVKNYPFSVTLIVTCVRHFTDWT